MFGITAFAEAPFASLLINVTVTVTGVSASGNVGSVSPGGSPSETGDVAYGYAGNVGKVITVSLTGVSAVGSTGSVNKIYWTTIIDTQDANWQNINNPETANWALADTAESAFWTLINNPETASWVLVDDGENATWQLINNAP
jgi:hypothetical protein